MQKLTKCIQVFALDVPKCVCRCLAAANSQTHSTTVEKGCVRSSTAVRREIFG